MPTPADMFESDDPGPELPAGRVPARRAASTLMGALGGLFGGTLALAVTDGATNRLRLVEHLRAATGRSTAIVSVVGATRTWIVVALVVGLVVGAVFGRLTRRLVPIVPRMLFGALLMPATWTVVYAFILPRVAPWLVPVIAFGPSLLGALVFGVCLALARARRGRRRSRFEELEQELREQELEAEESAADSFPLVRRRSWSRG